MSKKQIYWLAIASILSLSIIAYLIISKIPHQPKKGAGSPVIMPFKLELIASFPWDDSIMREPIFKFGLGTDQGEKKIRKVPILFLAPDGAFWILSAHGQLARWLGGQWIGIDTSKSDIENIVSIAPIANGEFLLLGQKGSNNILARLRNNGDLVWRREGVIDYQNLKLPLLQGNFDSIISDTDGNVYLPGVRLNGEISRINLTDGETPSSIDLGSYRAKIWIQMGKLYRVLKTDNSLREWIKRDIQFTKEESINVAPSLEDALSSVCSPLPSGGALLCHRGKLVWMSPQGQPKHSIQIDGIVRNKDRLEILDTGTMKLSTWTGGTQVRHFAVPTEFRGVRLIAANLETYKLVVPASTPIPEHIISINVMSSESLEISRESVRNYDDLLRIEGVIDMNHPIVLSDDSILLVGADPQGGFIVRLTWV